MRSTAVLSCRPLGCAGADASRSPPFEHRAQVGRGDRSPGLPLDHGRTSPFDLGPQPRQGPVAAVLNGLAQQQARHLQGALSFGRGRTRHQHGAQRIHPALAEPPPPVPHRLGRDAKRLGHLRAGSALQGQQDRTRTIRLAAHVGPRRRLQRHLLLSRRNQRGPTRHATYPANVKDGQPLPSVRGPADACLVAQDKIPGLPKGLWTFIGLKLHQKRGRAKLLRRSTSPVSRSSTTSLSPCPKS